MLNNAFGWAREEKLFSAATENMSFSSGPAKEKLAAKSRMDSNTFRRFFKAGYTLLAHGALNEYIARYIISASRGMNVDDVKPEHIKVFRKIEDITRVLETRPDKVRGQDILVASIPGLFKNTGQIGHVGLGRWNDQPVAYLDSKVFYNQETLEEVLKDAELHEKDEITHYEAKRQELADKLKRSVSYEEMRVWVKKNKDEAQKFHHSSRSLTALYQFIDAHPGEFELDLDAIFKAYKRHGFAEDDDDFNISAQSKGQHTVDWAKEMKNINETRWALIADKLGISYDKLHGWKKKNSKNARRISKQLDRIEELDNEIRLRLQKRESEDVVIRRSDPKFSTLYKETDEIVQRLLRAAGFKPDNFKLFILDSTEENAFIMPYTNFIFVNLGLIKLIVENGGSKDALAAVIAHEIRHMSQWIEDCIYGKLVKTDWKQILEGPADEYDADEALGIVDIAGYSVRDAALPMEKLIERDKGEEGREVSLGYMSHPPGTSRLLRLQRKIEKFFWLNYFNELTYFSEKSEQELNKRTARREYQEAVAKCNSKKQAWEHLEEAETEEEFIYTMMVYIQKFYHWELEAKTFYELFFEKFSPSSITKPMHRVMLDHAYGEAIGAHTHLEYHADTSFSRNGSVDRGLIKEFSEVFSSRNIAELTELLSLEFPGPLRLDSRDQKGPLVYDFDHKVIFDSMSHALVERLKALSIDDIIDKADDVARFADVYQRRFMEVKVYRGDFFVRDARDDIIKLLLKILTTRFRQGPKVSRKQIRTLLSLINSYVKDHDTILDDLPRALCEFMRSAPTETKKVIFKWLCENDGEKESRLLEKIFDFMAEDIDYIDIMPGMGISPDRDIDVLFSIPYFVRRNMCGLAHEDMKYKQAMILIIEKLSKKYGSLKAKRFDLLKAIMDKLRDMPLDVSRDISDIYDLYDALYDYFVELTKGRLIFGQIARELDMPRDTNPDVGRLIYFYNMGGVLNAEKFRDVISDIYKQTQKKILPKLRRELQIFNNLLVSMADEIRGRRGEINDVTIDRYWNKYRLPLAVFLSFDGKALDSDHHTCRRYDDPTKTRFGRFAGEFAQSWRRTTLDPFGVNNFRKTEEERGRGINRVFMTGEDAGSLIDVFDYIGSSDKQFDELLKEIDDVMPATAYRNLALYILFINKFIIDARGVDINMEHIFDLGYVQNIIEGLKADSRTDALNNLSEVISLMVEDKQMSRFNMPFSYSGRKLKEADRKRIISEHADEEGSYYPYEYTELGGPLSQIDIFTGLLAERYLYGCVVNPQERDISFSKRLKEVLKYFPRASNTRDQLLVRLIDENEGRVSSRDIEAVLPKFNNAKLRERYAVLALEKKRKERPDDFKTIDGEVGWIVDKKYFPDFSPTRDDLLLQVIDEKAKTPEDLQKARKYLLKAPENIRNKRQKQVMFGMSFFEGLLYEQLPADKTEFLLWLFGISDDKPFSVVHFEHEHKVSLTGLRDTLVNIKPGYYKNVGDTAKEEFLEKMLIGNNGIFYDRNASRLLLDSLFDKVMKTQNTMGVLKAFYDAVFQKAGYNRNCAIVIAMLKNYSKEEQRKEGVNRERAIRIFLESLGLIGVKTGQFLANFGNISEKLRTELELLKDRSAPLDKAIIFDMIAKMYGSFENSPFVEILECEGSASIKVVYKALMKHRDGEREVAVKIKRPDVEKRVDEDLAFLREVLGEKSVVDALRRVGIEIPKQISDRIAEMIHEEMDFTTEESNQNRLRENIGKPPGLKDAFFNMLMSQVFKTPAEHYSFAVPVIYDIKNNTLIVEEYMIGRPIKETDEGAVVMVARELLRQIFLDGVYHADPHSGNIFINENTKTISFIDFGSVAEISGKNANILRNLLTALQDGSEEQLMQIAAQIAGKDIPNLKEKMHGIVISENDIIIKMLGFFKFLDDSGVLADKQLLSVFRCFGQGELLFRKALLSTKTGDGEGAKEEGTPARCLETLKMSNNKDLLLKALDKNKGITAAELANLRPCSRRTVDREFEILKALEIFIPVKIDGEIKYGYYCFADIMRGPDENYTRDLINVINHVEFKVGMKGKARPLHRGDIPQKERDIVKEILRLHIVNYTHTHMRKGQDIDEPCIIKVWKGYGAPSQQSLLTQIRNATEGRAFRVSFEEVEDLISFACNRDNINDRTVTIMPFDILKPGQIASLREANAKVIYINLDRKDLGANDLSPVEGLVAIGRAYLFNDETAFYQLYGILTQSTDYTYIPLDSLKKDPTFFIKKLNFILKPITAHSLTELIQINERIRELLFAA